MINIASNFDQFSLVNQISESPNIDEKEMLLSLIDHGDINSYFQPILDLFSSSIYGYEMLARGKGPFFSPAEMFVSAEKNKIGWKLEYACRLAALKKIQSLDKSYNDKHFFLNVSPNIFNNPDFKSGFTSKYIKEHGLNHRRIVLEITETASISHYDSFEKLVKHYVEQGFKVALDDFGAGHSGLTTLVAMTPHFMKIDREIIRGIDSNPYKQNLVKTLCSFASTVGSNILAEGIETFEELESVYRLGVRYVQGFYIGRPSNQPEKLHQEVLVSLNKLRMRYRITENATNSFLNDIVIKPDTFSENTLTCSDLDLFFKRNQMTDHVVITTDSVPLRLITRQNFYRFISGRFGYSLYSKLKIEQVISNDFLLIENSLDLLAIKEIALNRNGNEAFDPIVIINEDGGLIGTITMKKLIEKAIDLEVYNAVNQNPLTFLPGNRAIRSWLNQISLYQEYSIVYIDIDHFKQYNDRYGFYCGDKMITLLSDILKRFKQDYVGEILLGHIGGDDFIMVFYSSITENLLKEICKEFDSRKIELFDLDDISQSKYEAVSRNGEKKDYPLTTISLSAFSNINFPQKICSAELAQYASELKSKVKKENYTSGKSGYIYERRIY